MMEHFSESGAHPYDEEGEAEYNESNDYDETQSGESPGACLENVP
jgi:hypothetical protein